MNRTIMSYTSAIVAVASWMQQNEGRAPVWHECVRANGLPHRVTLQYVCGGLTQAVKDARALLCVLSGASMTLLSFVSAPAPASVAQTALCLRCDRTIPRRPMQRLCCRCRAYLREEQAGDGDTGFVEVSRGRASSWASRLQDEDYAL